jgi:hypothetical protein
MTTPPADLSLPDRLRPAGFELILQRCPPWLFSAPYEAASALEEIAVPDRTYYSALLQVPAADVPDDRAVARRSFEILRQGGMVAFRIGPIDALGTNAETYTVLLSTGQANQVIGVLETIRANLGR